MNKRRLLLFDIDGTLITSGGAGEGALIDAMQERFGIQEDLNGITIAGATDALIARLMLDDYVRHLADKGVGARVPLACCLSYLSF